MWTNGVVLKLYVKCEYKILPFVMNDRKRKTKLPQKMLFY